MPKVTLKGVAKVLNALRIDGELARPGLFEFTRFERDAGPRTTTLKLLRANGGPLAPKVTAVEPEWVTTELREIELGERYELALMASPPWPRWAQHGQVTLKTGVPQQPYERIRFLVNVAPRLTVTPRSFGVLVPSAGPTELRVRLEWSSDAPPGRILEATVDDAALTVRVEKSATGQRVILQVPAGWQPLAEKQYCWVRLATNDPVASEVRIPISIVRLRGKPR